MNSAEGAAQTYQTRVTEVALAMEHTSDSNKQGMQEEASTHLVQAASQAEQGGSASRSPERRVRGRKRAVCL